MPQVAIKFIPRKINMDDNPLDIPADTSFFMKGVQVNWQNETPGAGQNSGDLKPLESNYLYCSVTLPEGENTCVGSYFFAEATECYIIVHNSLGNHLIYRMEGTTGQCRIVFRFCRSNRFPFAENEISSAITTDPLDYFSEGRIAMKSLCRYLSDGTKELYKEMLLVNKKVPNLRIVIEDSIATDSFTTPFFTAKNPCCGDRCRIIKVGVPTPMEDIKITAIPAQPSDANKQNLILNKMIKVRFRHETAWGQVSEHGIVSQPFIVNISNCSRDAAGLPHCLWVETKVPCPEIVRVIMEVQLCQLIGDTGGVDGSQVSDWKQYAILDLYDQTDPLLKWYERSYKANNDEFEFLNDQKDIRYKFCNNRECKVIAKADIRDSNPAPINSGTVAALGKGLVYGDNENFYNPLREADKEGISFTVEETENNCFPRMSKIVVYAVVHNIFDDQNNGVWPHNGKIGFGGFAPDATNDFEGLVMDAEPTSFNENGGYGQFFAPGVKGFRAVLAGTNYRATSTQMYWTPTSGLVDYEFSTEFDRVVNFMNEVRPGQKVLVQKFDFGYVPFGRYFFRIMGHAEPETVDLESTSTFYIGNYGWNAYKINYLPGGANGIPGNTEKEILINTSNGSSYDSLDIDVIAVIADMTEPSSDDGVGRGSKVVKGYLYEDRIVKQPIELAEYNPYGIGGRFTDHNGFFFHGVDDSGSTFDIKPTGFYQCRANEQLGQTVLKQKEGTSSTILYASDNFPDYAAKACNRWWISGIVRECGSSAGIAGVPVILRNTKPVFTNSNGEFRVIAHLQVGRGVNEMIFSPSGSCDIVNCNCGPIGDIAVVNQPICFDCGQREHLAGLFNFRTIVNKGFEHGSRVPIGIKAHDWLGRSTDIQTMLNWEVQIPTEQETFNPSYPRIKVTLPASFSADFCKNFKYLTFFTGNNPDYSEFLTWAADKVEFVDSAGNVTATGISKIKIWYRSLGEYNRIKGLNTNTTWSIADTVIDSEKKQILDKEGTPVYKNTAADYVEFIQNADGSYLPPGKMAAVEYDKDGSYFLIDYDVSLAGLKDGVKFKFKRPYICEINHPFYEYGFTLHFCNRDCKPRDGEGNVITSFYLDGYNAYMLPRQIPVVIDVPADGDTPATTIKVAKTYPFLFEHHSPSNTWGDHCFSGGRVGFKNPYEGRKCNRNQMMLTGALNDANDGAINYLHYFSLIEDYLLDEQGWGGITAIIVRADQQLLVITNTTTFSLMYNDNRAVVTQDGYIAVPTNRRLSRPDKDDGFAFGCQPKELNTLRKNGSIVMWVDAQKVAVVLHNFQSGIDVSAGIKSWLTPVIKLAALSSDIYLHGNFDNRGRDMKYVLTRFDRKLDQYVNQEIDRDINKNETVAYNFAGKAWEQMFHYTPEYFANMYGDLKDTQFFSIRKGLPYAHHNAVDGATVFLNYFGIQCFPVIGVVANTENTKVKSYIGVEVYSFDQLFISQKIETEMNQESKLLEGDFEWGEGFRYAAFLCDTANVDASLPASADVMFDGDTLYGRWLKATFQTPPNYAGEFFQLTAIIIRMFPREKSSV